MKYLFLLLLLPLCAQGQSADVTPVKTRSVELGFNLGHAFDNAWMPGINRGGYIRSSLSLLKRRGNMQYGLTAEGGTNSEDYWYVSPGLVVNRIFTMNQACFYAGAMAGYVLSLDMLGENYPKQKFTQGYVFGVQIGAVQPVGRRLSLTAELAVRSSQVWKEPSLLGSYFGGWGWEPPRERQSDVIIYLPVSVGIRYRL